MKCGLPGGLLSGVSVAGLEVCTSTRGLFAIARCPKLSPRGGGDTHSLCPVGQSFSVNLGIDFWAKVM